jgi:cytochrome c-type biogenesis protein CcmH/NrfG
MGFWRKDAIEPALRHETERQMDEQRAWIAREPGNARPYFHLAQFYRMEGRQEEALGLLLEAVRLQDGFGEAHVSLAEIYAIREDYGAAWDGRGVELLRRYGTAGKEHWPQMNTDEHR